MAGKRPSKSGSKTRPISELPIDLPIGPAELWWRLVEGRLEQLEAKLPTDLEGVLQFEVHTANGGAEHFHLCLAPSGTEARRGVAADVSAWIEADEDDLVLMLEGRDGAKLRTLGDLGLAQRLFGALASSLKGGSPLGLRAGG